MAAIIPATTNEGASTATAVSAIVSSSMDGEDGQRDESHDTCPSLHYFCSDTDITVDDFHHQLTSVTDPIASLLHTCDDDGFTALHHLCNQPMASAAIIAIAEIILMRCPQSAFIHATSHGKTPLHLAMNWARVRTDDTAIGYVAPILALFIKYVPSSLLCVDTRDRTPLHALLAGDGNASHTTTYLSAAPQVATMHARHIKGSGVPYTPFGNAIANCDESVMRAYLTTIRRIMTTNGASSTDITATIAIVLQDLTPAMAMDMAANSEWATVNWLVTEGATHIVPWMGFFAPPDCASSSCIITHGGKTVTGHGGATAVTRIAAGMWRWSIMVHAVANKDDHNNDKEHATKHDDNEGDNDNDGEGDAIDDTDYTGGILIGVANTRLVAAASRGCTEGWLGVTWYIDEHGNTVMGDRHGCRVTSPISSLSSSDTKDNGSSGRITSGDILHCYLDVTQQTFRVARVVRSGERAIGSTISISPSCHYFPYFHMAPGAKIELLDIQQL